MKMMESEKFASMLQKYVKETYYSHLSDMEFAIQLSKDMAGFFMAKKGMKPDQIKEAEGFFDKEVRESKNFEVIKKGDDLHELDESGFTKLSTDAVVQLKDMGFDSMGIFAFKLNPGEKDHLMLATSGHPAGFKAASEKLKELEEQLRKKNEEVWG